MLAESTPTGPQTQLLLGKPNRAGRTGQLTCSLLKTKLWLIQGTRKQSCTVLFMILYFSTMSSAIWWLVLCITWFMAAVLKWSGEAIEHQSQYFHLIAWSIPAIMTISVLALGKIEGDPLSGVCFVGQYDTVSLQTFLLWPQLSEFYYFYFSFF